MPKTLRNLIVLTLIITASCLDVMVNNSMTSETSLLTSTSTSSLMTITENSMTIATQDDSIPKNLSYTLSSSSSSDGIWACPYITKAGVTCSCDFPHTLRCTGDRTALQVIILICCHYCCQYITENKNTIFVL